MKYLLTRLLCLPFLLSLFLLAPAQAAMDHNMGVAHAAYTDRAFLSGMIAHHEGAVEMAQAFLKTAQSGEYPQVVAWAKAIVTAQDKEIGEMRDLLKSMGGPDQTAYTTMKNSMRAMLEAGGGTAPAVRFVSLMLPHHAEAVEMSVPALLYSDNPQVLELAKNIVMSQGEEMYQFKTWLDDMRRNAGVKPASKESAR